MSIVILNAGKFGGGGGGGSTTTSTPITAANFVGDDYTNPDLVGKTPQVNFNIFTNDGTGGLMDYPGSYTFNAGTGTITTTPGNYVVQIY
jgi:hypothetical protein